MKVPYSCRLWGVSVEEVKKFQHHYNEKYAYIGNPDRYKPLVEDGYVGVKTMQAMLEFGFVKYGSEVYKEWKLRQGSDINDWDNLRYKYIYAILLRYKLNKKAKEET